MKKLLVMGGSHSDVPLIESGLLRGFEVFTTGNRPDHPGHRISHAYLPGDFSKPDEMLAVARSAGIDFVVPGANDFAMLSAAYVAEKMGLPGFDSFEVTQLLHRKDLFKAYAAALGLPICRHASIQCDSDKSAFSQVEDLRFPLLIKPVDLTGGKGIGQVNEPAELENAIRTARALSRHSVVVAEEWFEGSLHSYSTVIEKGRVIYEYVDTELCVFQPYLVSTSISAADVHEMALESVRKATQKLIDELKLVDGVLHCQFLAQGTRAVILEYTRRMSGDLYSRVVQLVDGFRHADIFVDAATGVAVHSAMRSQQVRQKFVSRHCITAEQSGIFSGIIASEFVKPFVHSIHLAASLGSMVSADGRSKVAVVVLTFSSELEMQSFAKTCRQDFKCEVKQ